MKDDSRAMAWARWQGVALQQWAVVNNAVTMGRDPDEIFRAVEEWSKAIMTGARLEGQEITLQKLEDFVNALRSASFVAAERGVTSGQQLG